MAGVGFTGTIAINAHVELMSGMLGSAFAASFLPASRFGRNARVHAARKCLLCFCSGRKGLEARSGILLHRPLSARPIGEYAGLPP